MKNVSGIVSYNKSKRKWTFEPPKGPIHEFPAGNEGKTKANTLKIRFNSPKVANLLQNLLDKPVNHHLKRRAMDGSMILIDAELLIPADDDPTQVLARAASKHRTVEYIVTNGDYSLYQCTCADWYKGSQLVTLPALSPDRPNTGAPYLENVGIMCKHVWAYHFHTVSGWVLSIENPNQKELAGKLFNIVKGHMENTPAIDMLNEGKPMSMSRGRFTIALKDNHVEELRQDADLYERLRLTVGEATNYSQALYIM